MIVEDSDPGFWSAIAAHPEVRHVLGDYEPEAWGEAVQRGIALRAEHGGFVFFPADSLGFAYELHTMFTPEGWGREVFAAAREAFEHIFARADLIMTHETRHPQSRPAKTFGFRAMGAFRPTRLGDARLWCLTREAWSNAPARSRKCQQQP